MLPLAPANNHFLRPATGAADVQLKALAEFDDYVTALRRHGVEVLMHNDREAPHTPDSIFPNNWWSSHPDGTLVLYPMQSHNRRLERNKAEAMLRLCQGVTQLHIESFCCNLARAWSATREAAKSQAAVPTLLNTAGRDQSMGPRMAAANDLT